MSYRLKVLAAGLTLSAISWLAFYWFLVHPQ